MELGLLVSLVICFLIVPPIILFLKISDLRSEIETLRKEVKTLRKHLGMPEPEIKSYNPYNAPINQLDPQSQKIHVQAKEQPQFSPVANQAEAVHAPQTAAVNSPVFYYFANMTAGKAFSWIGGLLLFLGVVFAIKYSFENNLVSAQMRMISGAILGLALVTASFFIKAEKFKVTSNTLCAAGLAVLYGVVFSSTYFYDFLSPAAAFLMMGGVSLAAFWLASHKKTQYIGYLGVITGFLTPIILSTGSRNYLMLFAYLAFINAGAIGAGVKEGWDKLVFTTLGFTLLFQLVWFFPTFSPSKITDFCIIFAAYTAAAAVVAWFYRKKLSEHVRLSFGLYIAASFLIIFLTDFSLPSIGLAFFINLLLAALFYCEAQVYNVPFKIVNIAAFLLLAVWLCSESGKAQNSILLLMASLIFTALNALVSMVKNVREDSYTAALPVAALLLMFFMPDMNLWILYPFTLIIAAAATVSAFRSDKEPVAYITLAVFAAFLLRSTFPPWQNFGLFELAAGLLYATGLLCALSFGGYLPGKSRSFSIAAGTMPYLFLTVFILENQRLEILGLVFCAGISAIILAISYFNKNKYYPLIAAACAFLPQIITAGSQVWLNEYTILYMIIWALFFAYPFVIKDEEPLPWLASVLAGATLLVTSFISCGYVNITATCAFITIIYGAAAFFTGRNAAKWGEKRKNLFAALAWVALFIFINTQIAHYYTPGDKLVFKTEGNLAKTVVYTLAWGIYGMLTLFTSIGSRSRYGVFAGIGLVVTALFKLFVSDVWMLSTAYRVVIFIGMAVILIAGSFFYQALTEMLKKPRE